MKKLLLQSIILVGAGLAAVSGCTPQSAPTRFYVLTSLPPSDPKIQPPVEQCVAIGVGPVELPEYLDRPQIVTRINSNELKLAEFDNWAESLENNFTRVLVENISTLLCAEPILIFPWTGSTPIDYQVEIHVLRFDGKLGDRAGLIARWSINEQRDRTALITRRSTFSERVESNEYEALVAAENRILESLSRVIAAELSRLIQKNPGS